MNATAVVIAAEFLQLAFQVKRIPEEHAIEKLTANGSDQALRKLSYSPSCRHLE
jgi:hypothetical protein